jgi:anthranilate/para-aminobenzoate synthase component I
VIERRLPFWVDPEVAFTLFDDERFAFWLDDGSGSDSARSYQGFASPWSWCAEMPPGTSGVTVRRVGKTLEPGAREPLDGFQGSVFDLLRATTPGLSPGEPAWTHTIGGLGWVGWFGYELGARLTGTPHRRARYPDAAMMLVDRLLVFDHADHSIRVRMPDADDPSRHPAAAAADRLWLDEVVAALGGLVGRAPVEPVARTGPARPAWLRHGRAEYLRLLEQCRGSIVRGDAYQICLTDEIIVPEAIDSARAYHRLRRASPTAHGGLIRYGEVTLLSSSPELFLRVSPGGLLETGPIKGTRPRGGTPGEDEALATELRNDPKEIAENIMIVDLMRNDLGRIAAVGSVEVPDLLRVESYRTVHQLVSTVRASLQPGGCWVDALESCLPAGSMTGAPKHSAMTAIDRLEAGPRGLYAGAFGQMGLNGGVELAVTIRSLVVGSDLTTIGVGGGVTEGSRPDREFDEILIKAAALLEAAEAELRATA